MYSMCLLPHVTTWLMVYIQGEAVVTYASQVLHHTSLWWPGGMMWGSPPPSAKKVSQAGKISQKKKKKKEGATCRFKEDNKMRQLQGALERFVCPWGKPWLTTLPEMQPRKQGRSSLCVKNFSQTEINFSSEGALWNCCSVRIVGSFLKV